MHGFLLLVLLIAPAFISRRVEPELPVITFIPDQLTDSPFFNSGAPESSTPAEAAVTPPAAATPEPPPAEPLPPVREPEPKIEPEPPKPAPSEPKVQPKAEPKVPEKKAPPEPELEKPKKSDPAESAEPKPRRKKIEPTFERPAETSTAAERARARAQALERQLQARNSKVSDLTQRLRKGLSTGTEIKLPTGVGGAAYANYAQVVKSTYQLAWIPPSELADDAATVTVTVTIARSGHVERAEIIQKSGDAALDGSVRRLLDAIKFIAPFPAETRDQRREFTIDFNVNSTRR